MLGHSSGHIDRPDACDMVGSSTPHSETMLHVAHLLPRADTTLI